MSLAALLAADGVPHEHGPDYTLARCDHATLAGYVRAAGIVADALIVDAPYSERTHAGHDSQESYDASGAPRDNKKRLLLGLPATRRGLGYAAWDGSDVSDFVRSFAPITRGWMCSLTDHALAGAWEVAMVGAGRYAFSPIACVESGSRCRMSGDGPSQWSTWLVVSRPRTREWQSWGTLPGAYVGTTERGREVMGGKPLWLMAAIVRDYTAPGDVVIDPCAGGGTTLVAAVEAGRIAIGCEPDAERYAIACRRVREARRPMGAQTTATQLVLGAR